VVVYPSIGKYLLMAKPSPLYRGTAELVALGSRIRSSRLAIGMSQEELAHKADLDRSYVGGIERGEHNLTFMSLVKLASALNMKVCDLTDRIQ